VTAGQDESERRLRWQCRRGLLELDLLFARFLDHRYAGLSSEQQGAFQRLLDQPDQTILAWFQGQQAPPVDLKSIIEKVIQ